MHHLNGMGKKCTNIRKTYLMGTQSTSCGRPKCSTGDLLYAQQKYKSSMPIPLEAEGLV